MPRHGREANILADIVKVLLDSQERNYEAFTPITMEVTEEGGIEPDYCFYIDNWQAVVGKDRINWQTEPPPDLVLEIDVTTYTDVVDYIPYRVPEVWLFKKNRLLIHWLENAIIRCKKPASFFSILISRRSRLIACKSQQNVAQELPYKNCEPACRTLASRVGRCPLY
jgi:Uma2 family endonuclease